MNPTKLDHVAYWVADRDAIADFATTKLGMHVIERTDAFTLVGADARRGKLTLFAAEGPRERGALKHVGCARPRTSAKSASSSSGKTCTSSSSRATTTTSITSRSSPAIPRRLRPSTGRLGFRPAAPGPSGAPRVEVGGAWIEFHAGEPGTPERPLLNHIAVLVDSAEEHIAAANDLGVEIDDIKDAPNTYAVFLRGPEGVRIEYVEHKPTFSLT